MSGSGTSDGVRASRGAGRASSLPTPFVGREPELKLLLKCWREAVGGAPGAVFISGEPGIGKTRLAWELVLALDAQDVLALFGRCDPDRLVPYQPFVEALESLRTACPPEMLLRYLRDMPSAELGRLAPTLAADLSLEQETLPSDPRAERHRLFTAVTALFQRLAVNRPTVLVLEDLHWADQPTLRLLRYMLRSPAEDRASAKEAGLLVIGTYRETELAADDPLAELLADLRRDDLGTRLTLTGIPEDAVARLARSVSGRALAVEHARELHRATGGNPFFVKELARSPGRRAVPDSVRDAVAQRLDRLDPGTRELLTVASALGPKFSFDLIEQASGLHGMAIADAVDQGCAAGLIEELEPSMGTFAHSIVRSAVYDRLGDADRAALHLRIAEALERLGDARDGEQLAELAHHFLAAGDAGRGRGASYAVRAGRQAFARLAYEAAAEYWERALEVLGPPRRREGVELLLELAEAHWRSGEFEQARERYAKAAQLARELTLPDLLAVAALGFGGRMGFGAGVHDAQLIALLELALDALPDGDGRLRARVLARLAEALTYSEQRDRIPGLCEQATAMARRIGDPGVLGAVLMNVRFAIWGPSNAGERCALAEEVIELSQATGDLALEVDGRLSRVVDLLERGDTREVDEELELCSRKAQEVRQRYQLWWLACLLALRALMAGRVDEADELAAHALQIGQRDRNQNALQIYGVQLAGVRREQGRYAELEDGLKAFIAQYPAIPTWRCALAFLYADAGRADEARQELDELGTDGFASLPRDLFWLADMTLLGQAAVSAGAAEHARALYELLEPHARQNVLVAIAACWGSTSRVLALLAQALGRGDDAARHFEDAIEQNSRIGAAAWRARSEVEYAQLLLAGGKGQRARELLRNASQTANQLGLADIAARAEAALSER